MAKRPELQRGDLVKIRDRKTGELSVETYRVVRTEIPTKDQRRTRGTYSTSEGYAMIKIRAKGQRCIVRDRRNLWRVPNKLRKGNSSPASCPAKEMLDIGRSLA